MKDDKGESCQVAPIVFFSRFNYDLIERIKWIFGIGIKLANWKQPEICVFLQVCHILRISLMWWLFSTLDL